MPPIAYSYVRFSTPIQAEGDSLRRQTQAAREWCEQNGVSLDQSITLHDLGRSAYTGSHRVNPDRNSLAVFLHLVESGRVPRGSFLLIENLDRLSREHIQPALLLVLNLLQMGIKIVQLKPAEMIFTEASDTLPVMVMMLELSRGHGESRIKSERVGAAWEQKRKAAREQGKTMTRKLPGWIEDRDGERVLIPERAETVRRIFELAIAGYGSPGIAAALIREGREPFGSSGVWNKEILRKILAGRQALGELQPRRMLKDDGPPVPGFFPAVIDEKTWQAAQAAIRTRLLHRGKTSGKHVNPFSGLIECGLSGSSYYSTPRLIGDVGKKKPFRILINTDAPEGRGKARTYPYEHFEQAVCSLLREVRPEDILGTVPPDETQALASELAGVEARIAEIEEELLSGDVASLARVLRTLETQRQKIAVQLAEARQKAASPLSEQWGEAHSLLQALATAPDQRDARLRLRACLRRIVEKMLIVVVGRGRARLAAVQVLFVGGARRDYLIISRPAQANAASHRPASWSARSLSSLTDADLPPLDLRNREHAQALAELLQTIDPKRLEN